jgi:NAD(P)-dependent dehydrogenase (short-subunit alcohol dehydrogenase family)
MMTKADTSQVPDYGSLGRVDGRTFVVVGAGQGMGRQSCHALAQAGASRVVCVDIDSERAGDVAAEIGCGVAWAGDGTSRPEVRRLASDLAGALGTVDGLIDIVGLAYWSDVLNVDDELWDRQFDICLRHAFLLTQEVGRLMVDQGSGSFVFIASVSGLSGAPRHAAYGAAKAGLMSWVRSVAVELGPHGIRANAIAPGGIVTPRGRAMMGDDRIEAMGNDSPLRRMGETSEIAGVALFLSSPLSSYITGQTLVVDGGTGLKFQYGTM